MLTRLITFAGGVGREDAEAGLILFRIQKRADQRARSVGVAQRFVFQHTEPVGEANLIRVAPEEREVMEGNERLIVLRVDDLGLCCESSEYGSAANVRIVEQTDQS